MRKIIEFVDSSQKVSYAETKMYSNCLFEAIKAKLKNPRNVKIIWIPKEANDGSSHFFWSEGDSVFHVVDARHGEKRILFEFIVEEVPLDVFKKYLLDKLAGSEKLEKYAKKFDLPLERTQLDKT